MGKCGIIHDLNLFLSTIGGSHMHMLQTIATPTGSVWLLTPGWGGGGGHLGI